MQARSDLSLGSFRLGLTHCKQDCQSTHGFGPTQRFMKAVNFMSTAPDWKPHTLALQVEQLAKPKAITQPCRRSERINIDYLMSNKKKETTGTAKK